MGVMTFPALKKPASFLSAFLPGASRSVARERLWFLSHHKCGTAWLSFVLKDISRLNGLRFHETYASSDVIPDRTDICLISNADYARLPFIGAARPLHVIRNPLSIIVSAYHSHRTTHDTDGWPELLHQRKLLQHCSVEHGMYLTLAYLERGAGAPLNDIARWQFGDTRITTVKFEDLVRNPADWLAYAIKENGYRSLLLPEMQDYSFEKMSGGRHVGEIDDTSHYRSGSADGWRNELPKPIIQYVRTHYEGLLKGYYPESMED